MPQWEQSPSVSAALRFLDTTPVGEYMREDASAEQACCERGSLRATFSGTRDEESLLPDRRSDHNGLEGSIELVSVPLLQSDGVVCL